MLKVYGFPRSGNNLLAKYIADTFYPERDTSKHNVRWGHWSNRQRVETNPYAKCLGSHTEFPAGALTIVRRPIAVAYSVWRSEEFRNINDYSTFGEFIRKPLDWRYDPSVRYDGDKTIVHHHVDHLYESRFGRWIGYNQLVNFPLRTMQLIGGWFDLEIKQFHRIETPVGYSPNWGHPVDIEPEDAGYIMGEFIRYIESEYPNVEPNIIPDVNLQILLDS